MVELFGELPSPSPEREAAIAFELLDVAAALEPFAEQDVAASRAFARAMIALGLVSEDARQGMPLEACWERARGTYARLPPWESADLELEIGQTLRRQGRMGEARDVLVRALPALDPVPRPWALVLLADIDRLRGESDLALEGLDQAEALLDGDVEFHARIRPIVFGLRGILHLELGLLDEAARWIELERRSAVERGDSDGLRTARIHRAALLCANLREVAVAREVQADMEEELARAGPPAARAVLLAIHARVRAELALAGVEGEGLDEARSELEEALASPHLDLEDRVGTRLALARVRLAAGEPDAAAEELERARGDVERLTAGLPGAGRARDRGLLAAVRVEIALVRRATTGDAEGSDSQAIDGAELGAAVTQAERAFDALLGEWGRTALRRGGVGYLHFHERLLVIDALVRADLERLPGEAGVRSALERVLRAQALSTLARELEARPASVEDARALQGERGGALVYLSSLERSHVFALDRFALRHAELPSAVELEEAVREHTALLESPPRLRGGDSGELERAGRRLADLLVPSAIRAQVEGWDAVTIVGAELFGSPSFESLSWGGREVLGLSSALAYVPSLSLWLALEGRAAARIRGGVATDGDALILAVPGPSDPALARWPKLEPLPLEREELTQLANRIGRAGARVSVRFGAAVTPSCLDALAPTAASVLALFAHGVYDAERERPAGLALAPDDLDPSGLAWCERVETWSVPPLVALLACGASRGPLRMGDDGVSHLGGAFLRAGAETVVLARGDLELAAAREMGGVFLESLWDGLSPAAALRAARRSVASDARWTDPFYHSLLHVTGLAHRPLFPARVTAERADSPVPLSAAEPSKWSGAWIAGAFAALALAVAIGARRGRLTRY